MKKGQISRRNFLEGSGKLLALPMLESVVPINAFAQALPAPRVLIATWGMGWINDERFYPDGSPHLSNLDVNKSVYLKPFAGLENYISILSNLHNPVASFPCDFDGGGHGGAAVGLLTCGVPRPKQANGNLPLVGESIDQIIGKSLYSSRGTMSTLVLGTPDGNDNVESWGFPYNRYTSYRKDAVTGKYESAPLILNPKVAFDQVLSASTPSVTPPGMVSPLKSLVDFVMGDAKNLRRKVSKSDQQTLDRYLANVHDLQNSISQSAGQSQSSVGLTCNGTRPNTSDSLWWDVHPQTISQMNDIIAMSFQCDRTRVINYAMGQCQSVINFNRLGLKTENGTLVDDEDHHATTHVFEKNPVTRTLSHRAIGVWYMKRMADLLWKLKNTPDPVFGGNLLDNTIVVITTEMSSGNHWGNHIPTMIAGGGAGLLTNRGKYYNFGTRSHSFSCTTLDGKTHSTAGGIAPDSSGWRGYPISSLYLALMQKLGVKGSDGQLISSFQDSVGALNIG